jgi:Flp pilus assembly protein TadG
MALLIFGAMEIGSVLYQQQILTKGVKEAARYAARSPALAETGSCPPGSASWPGVEAQAKNLATRGSVSSGALILPNFTASDLNVAVSCVVAAGFVGPNPASGQIPIVVVSASITAKSPGFLGLLNLPAFTLTASHQEFGVGL